ncbi:hypothetical protein DIPPA_58848 [Diplonema papillatum]|nr:hypothetical protein DIPPA_58846 [Diplonema papillatum]KAJ9446237.1 hypothetical protein DIPPA_58848 [Diplonema papillatum]
MAFHMATYPYTVPSIVPQPGQFAVGPVLQAPGAVAPVGFVGAGYGCGVTALDTTKAEAFTAAHKAHAASLDRANYEATAFNTTMHARQGNNARYAQAAARDASEIDRYNATMLTNREIAFEQDMKVRTNPTTLVAFAPAIPPVQYQLY